MKTFKKWANPGLFLFICLLIVKTFNPVKFVILKSSQNRSENGPCSFFGSMACFALRCLRSFVVSSHRRQEKQNGKEGFSDAQAQAQAQRQHRRRRRRLPIGDKKNKTEKKGFRTLKLKLKLNVNIVVVVIPWEQKMENKFAFAIERGWPESYLNKLVKRSHNTWNMQSESFISA